MKIARYVLGSLIDMGRSLWQASAVQRAITKRCVDVRSLSFLAVGRSFRREFGVAVLLTLSVCLLNLYQISYCLVQCWIQGVPPAIAMSAMLLFLRTY